MSSERDTVITACQNPDTLIRLMKIFIDVGLVTYAQYALEYNRKHITLWGTYAASKGKRTAFEIIAAMDHGEDEYWGKIRAKCFPA